MTEHQKKMTTRIQENAIKGIFLALLFVILFLQSIITNARPSETSTTAEPDTQSVSIATCIGKN
jgi:hypothetical protein